MAFPNIVRYAHLWIEERTKLGDTVIDATMGGGNDTAFLAQLVGSEGQVYAFDIQLQALKNTRSKLQLHGCDGEHIKLILRSHAEMAQAIPAHIHGTVSAVMFNLGYLPGCSNHSVITQAPSTILALDAALSLLKSSGIVTIAIYQGHEGAASEVDAVEQWAAQLPQPSYRAIRYQFLNQKNLPPYLIAVEKR